LAEPGEIPGQREPAGGLGAAGQHRVPEHVQGQQSERNRRLRLRGDGLPAPRRRGSPARAGDVEASGAREWQLTDAQASGGARMGRNNRRGCRVQLEAPAHRSGRPGRTCSTAPWGHNRKRGGARDLAALGLALLGDAAAADGACGAGENSSPAETFMSSIRTRNKQKR